MRLVAIGLAAGLLSALLGVGGGIVVVPLLVAFVGLAPRPATGTSLAAVWLTALVGAISYAVYGDVDPGAAAIVGLPAGLGAVCGTALQQRLATRKLALGFALLLTGAAVRLLV